MAPGCTYEGFTAIAGRGARALTRLSLVLGLALGCRESPGVGELGGETQAQTETEAGTETGDTPPEPCTLVTPLATAGAPVPWSEAGEVEIADDGSSATIMIPLAAGQRYHAIRTVALDGDPLDNHQLCHDLIDARLVDAGTSLIAGEGEPLLDSHQRHLARPGPGIFVFSNVEAPLLPASSDTLELRVQMRNCSTQTPASRGFFPGMATRVRIDVASEPELAVGRVGVRVLIAEDSGWDLSDVEAMLAVARARFAAAGLELELGGAALLSAVGRLDYDANLLPMRSLHERALTCLRGDADDERFIPVAFVPCLRFEEPGSSSSLLGQTTHVPGLFDEDTTPSIVVIASDSCVPGSDPALASERYGLVLAHELGHYLGLHHSDTQLGGQLGADAQTALMDSSLATSVAPADAYFSSAQAAVLRRHPDVTP